MAFFDCITDFIFIEDEPEPSDILFIPGGPYPDAARYAAGLYRQGLAPYVMPSGRYSIGKSRFEWEKVPPVSDAVNCAGDSQLPLSSGGKSSAESSVLLSGDGERSAESSILAGTAVSRSGQPIAYDTECAYLCAVLAQGGVPQEAMIREEQATFTYENAIFSRRRTDELGITVKRAILCCQAFHARRSLLYYQEQFPETHFFVCPVVTRGISRDSWHTTEAGIDTVLGEVERCGGQFHAILRQHMNAAENKISAAVQ